MNGGNISDGQKETSGSVIGVPESPKWRRRYEEQTGSANHLSILLRTLRAKYDNQTARLIAITASNDTYQNKCVTLEADNDALQDRITELENAA